jgi:hypothetical protein
VPRYTCRRLAARERTTDPYELFEAAGETYFDQDPTLQRIDAVTRDVLVDAGARGRLR